MNLPNLKELVRAVCDPENQPHQWIGKPEELWKKLFGTSASTEAAKLFKDGDKWCCLMGPNVQEGIVGFGDTQEEAVAELAEAVTKFIREF